MKKRFVSVLLALATMFSLCVSASAAAADPVIETFEIDGYTIEVLPGDPSEFMTGEKVHIPVHWYDGQEECVEWFDCELGKGNAVNVWLDNREGNGDLTVVFYLNGVKVSDPRLRLAQGQQQTYRIQNNDKSEMDDHIQVNISSYDYHNMHFQIAARQFEYVG